VKCGIEGTDIYRWRMKNFHVAKLETHLIYSSLSHHGLGFVPRCRAGGGYVGWKSQFVWKENLFQIPCISFSFFSFLGFLFVLGQGIFYKFILFYSKFLKKVHWLGSPSIN
jgi:hypothetical protein